MITSATVDDDGRLSQVTRMGVRVTSAPVERLIRHLTAAECDADQRSWIGAHVWHHWLGAWAPGRRYPVGYLADRHGLTWVAIRATEEEPGTGMDWHLAHQRLRVVPHKQLVDETAITPPPKKRTRSPATRKAQA